MTGDNDTLDNFLETSGGMVTFGDRVKGSIKEKGQIASADTPQLADVYLVEGLRENLISISQLCDEGLKVVFTKVQCEAIDDNGNTVLSSVRSGNNCYIWKEYDEYLSAVSLIYGIRGLGT